MHNLTAYNTYRIEAKAEKVFFPDSIDALVDVIQNYPDAIILGNGSNIILGSPIYKEQVFIILRENFSEIFYHDNLVIAAAGASLKQLSIMALEHCLSGVEVFYDVPASVGGAIWMNAGAYGTSIYDHLKSVQTLDRQTGLVKTYQKNDIQYVYRHTMFQEMSEIILSVSFEFQSAVKEVIKTKMDEILALRQSKLPQEPSGGSVFKRPDYHITVGEMVEKIGLKGYQIGGAKISEKHGGVIVNHQNATASDIIQLIEKIKQAVWENYQVTLELEQIVI